MTEHARILVLAPSVQADKGEALVALKQLEALLGAGYDVICVASQCDLKHPKLKFVKVRLPSSPSALSVPCAVFINTLVAKCVQWRFRRDVITHMHGARALVRCDVLSVHFSVRTYMRKIGVSRSRSVSAAYRLNSWTADYVRMLVETWLFARERVQLLVPVSVGMGRELQQELGVPSDRIRAVTNGVDSDRFFPSREEKRRCRRKLGIGDDELVAVLVGGDWARKGVALVVEALSKSGDWKLLMVGDGDPTWLSQRLHEYNVAKERVTWVGHVTDSGAFMRAADVFVLPTAYETFCLAAYEAAATALPIIATDVSGINELLDRTPPIGIKVERTATSVAAALETLRSEDIRVQMGENARVVAKAYDWNHNADAYLAVIDEVALKRVETS